MFGWNLLLVQVLDWDISLEMGFNICHIDLCINFLLKKKKEKKDLGINYELVSREELELRFEFWATVWVLRLKGVFQGLYQCTKVSELHHHLAEMVWNKLQKCCNKLYNVTITSENFTLVIYKGHVLRVREPHTRINFHCSSRVTYTVTWSRVSLPQNMVFAPQLLRQRGFTHKSAYLFMFSILLILSSCHYPNPIYWSVF